MALSGSVSTNAYEGRYISVSWTATQSVSGNYSTVSYTIKAVGGSSSWYYTGPVTVTINGTNVYNQTNRPQQYAGTLKSGSLTISHNNDGSKDFSISIRAAIYTVAVNCTGSKTFTLNKIPRNPNAPTAVTISTAVSGKMGYGEEITLSWSGASGVISSYELQVKQADNDWVALKTVTTTATSGSTTDSFTISDHAVNGAGKARKYRVRAMNGTLPSSWLETDELTVSGRMSINVSGSWRPGSTWINIDGTWKRAKCVWVNVDGTWKPA